MSQNITILKLVLVRIPIFYLVRTLSNYLYKNFITAYATRRTSKSGKIAQVMGVAGVAAIIATIRLKTKEVTQGDPVASVGVPKDLAHLKVIASNPSQLSRS